MTLSLTPGPLTRRLLTGALIGLVVAAGAAAQEQPDKGPATDDSSADSNPTTIFNHSRTSRWWISGQFNTILQWHPEFEAKYSGTNSLRAAGENASSRLMTLYTGFEVTKTTEVFFDLESAGGKGISDALGLAGFTNLDVVRNPTLGQAPYLARLMIRQIIPLPRSKSEDTVEAERGPLSLATRLPARRLEIRAGKFSTADFFDVNTVGSDSHLQFMNWTVDNNGAFDYAADTRGYTWGVILEYQDRKWALRFGECLMPKVANGIKLDWNLGRARGENLEFELRQSLVRQHQGVIRLLGYVNHANMGSYKEAIDAFESGGEGTPDITAHRRLGRVKYGFGLNAEQELGGGWRVFGRLGWNDGRNESFAYTEVDRTVEAGADLRGEAWKRPADKAGVALVSNAISSVHRRYLGLGGLGFLLGDGALTYGRETIVETYYTAHLWRGIFASFDLQHIANPGYNKDRGPVVVPAVRAHVDF